MEKNGRLTGNKFAYTTCSFQKVSGRVQGHFNDTNNRVDKTHYEARDHIDRPVEYGEYDLEDGGDEILDGSDD